MDQEMNEIDTAIKPMQLWKGGEECRNQGENNFQFTASKNNIV